MLLTAVFSRIPAKIVTEKPLVVREINGRNYYWNYEKQRWTRLTKRCPYLT